MGLTDREYYRDEQAGWHLGSGRSMVFTLVIVNAAVLVADLLFGGSQHRVAGWLSLDPLDLWRPWLWWHFLTYGFVHDPDVVGHIVLNMFVLYMFGRDVEGHFGPRSFLRFYLSSIVICGLVWAVRQVLLYGPDVSARLIGASGAVTATFLAFVCLYPRRTILLFFVIPLPAWVVGVLFVLVDLAGFQSGGPAAGWGQVAFDVHLVGAVLGLLYGRYGSSWQWSWPGLDPSRWWRRLWRPRLRVRHEDLCDDDSDMDRRADALLDKVAKHGINSLTPSERRFLEQYSRRVRQRSLGPR
ncbi:MAG: rhomboid family intramembrane serine protease [Pirellulaceae bacterium]|nr:MAG: rhomboid family intramembrane serine protease [Pirellulaceae bacterium]